jgi:hypothetical protein
MRNKTWPFSTPIPKVPRFLSELTDRFAGGSECTKFTGKEITFALLTRPLETVTSDAQMPCQGERRRIRLLQPKLIKKFCANSK